MPVPILPISLPTPAIPATKLATVSNPGEFQSAFAEAVTKVESFQQNAQQSVERFLSGENEELHRVALDTQQADLSFQLFMQVRNKVVSAYQEIMRMQI